MGLVEYSDTKRILLIAATPSDANPLTLPKEFREIEEGIKLAENRDLYEIKQIGAIRYNDLRRELLSFKPHILHYSGHGSFQGLSLEDDSGSTQIASNARLVELFAKFTNHLECIIFNACSTQNIAMKCSRYIPYSIGMKTEISDPAAIEFSIGFYDAIGDGRTYEDAFEFGVNNINSDEFTINRSLDENETNTQNESLIPKIFIKEQLIPHQSLSQNEKDFVSKIFSQIHQGVPQVILSQLGRDTAQMARQLKQHAEIIFQKKRILHIYPPASKSADESSYFRRLGRQCNFTEPCHNSTDWAGYLEDELYDDEPLFLLVTDFEKGADASRRALAGELRQLQEVHNQQLKIIVFGGEKLAEQVFVACELSFLNHANTQYVPELEIYDLQENPVASDFDETTLKQILLVTGGHPLLIRQLLNAHNHNFQQQLQQSPIASQLFIRYRDKVSKLCQWLQQEQLGDFEDWPMDELLRELYWNNLLKRHQGKFKWRCEIIREMGCKVLAC